MKCKTCGKDLIGKEKLFCKSCWSKGAEKAKVGAMTLGSLVLTVVVNKKLIINVLKDGSKVASKIFKTQR